MKSLLNTITKESFENKMIGFLDWA